MMRKLIFQFIFGHGVKTSCKVNSKKSKGGKKVGEMYSERLSHLSLNYLPHNLWSCSKPIFKKDLYLYPIHLFTTIVARSIYL